MPAVQDEYPLAELLNLRQEVRGKNDRVRFAKLGNQRKALNPGDKPEVCFSICEGDEVEAVYAYCNLHSLWKA